MSLRGTKQSRHIQGEDVWLRNCFVPRNDNWWYLYTVLHKYLGGSFIPKCRRFLPPVEMTIYLFIYLNSI